MEEKDLHYSRCPNCGRYFASEESAEEKQDNMFCSQECGNFYRVCFSCGNYFTSSRSEVKIYCSETCGVNPEPEVHPQELPSTPAHDSQEIAVDNL